MRANWRANFPLATVYVRWHPNKHDPGYDWAQLAAELAKLGRLLSLELTSPVSGRAVYDSLAAACRAVQAHSVGRPANPIRVYWYHRQMAGRYFYGRGNGLWVKVYECQ